MLPYLGPDPSLLKLTGALLCSYFGASKAMICKQLQKEIWKLWKRSLFFSPASQHPALITQN